MKNLLSGIRLYWRHADRISGMTLVELLMAMAMGTMLIGAVYTIYVSQVKGQIIHESSLAFQQGLRSALLTMKAEIRTAGMDPTGKAGAEIVSAQSGSFRFTRDVSRQDGSSGFDGEISGPDEDIRYAVNSSGNLGRETCRHKPGSIDCGGLQAIMNNVDIINYVYLDDEGKRIIDADLATQAGRSAIARIQVTLIARYEHSRKESPSDFTDSYVFRNQFGDPLMTGVIKNGNRRFKTMTTIAVRNYRK